MPIGPRHDAICCIILSLAVVIVLPWVDEIRYLGVFVVRNRRFKFSFVNSKRHADVNNIVRLHQ